MINNVTLVGYLDCDPEFRTLESSVSVCALRVVTSETLTSHHGDPVEKKEIHRVLMWRGLADYCRINLVKGSMVLVEGKLSYRKLSSEGVPRTVAEIICKNIKKL